MYVLRWIADYWWIPLLALGAVLSAIFLMHAKPNWRKTGLPFQPLQEELAAIRAKREARDLQIQLGADEARRLILAKYEEKRKDLDERAQARVKNLEDDPEKLAEVLERLTR